MMLYLVLQPSIKGLAVVREQYISGTGMIKSSYRTLMEQ